MPLPSSVRCAIFDLDGTLLDSLEDLADSANAMLRARGFPEHPLAHYRYFVGDGAWTLVQRILPLPLQDDHALIHDCLHDYKIEYGKRWNLKTRPYAGIPELLAGLAERQIVLTVLSNKPHGFTVKCIEALCPPPAGSEWSVVLGLRDGARPKPDPGGVQEILHDLDIPASETLYFGDTSTDMKTAVSAGVFPIGVLWGFRSREELEQSGAKLILDQPCDLFSHLTVSKYHEST